MGAAYHGSLAGEVLGRGGFHSGPGQGDPGKLCSRAHQTGLALCLLAINRSLDPQEQATIEETLAEVTRICEVWMGLPPGHSLAATRLQGVRFVTDFQELDHAQVQRATGC